MGNPDTVKGVEKTTLGVEKITLGVDKTTLGVVKITLGVKKISRGRKNNIGGRKNNLPKWGNLLEVGACCCVMPSGFAACSGVLRLRRATVSCPRFFSTHPRAAQRHPPVLWRWLSDKLLNC